MLIIILPYVNHYTLRAPARQADVARRDAEAPLPGGGREGELQERLAWATMGETQTQRPFLLGNNQDM